MMTPEINLYFKALCKRIGDGDTVTLYFCPATDRKPVARECHANIDEWAKLNSGREAVRGWLVQANFGDGGYLLAAHSVGWENGRLYDITPPDGEPLDPNEPRVFVRHDGTMVDFDVFRRPEWSSVPYHATPLSIVDILSMPSPREHESEWP